MVFVENIFKLYEKEQVKVTCNEIAFDAEVSDEINKTKETYFHYRMVLCSEI